MGKTDKSLGEIQWKVRKLALVYAVLGVEEQATCAERNGRRSCPQPRQTALARAHNIHAFVYIHTKLHLSIFEILM